LNEVGFNSAVDLLGTYAGRGPELRGWVTDAQINRDRNLRLQYLAGMANTSFLGGPIYSSILEYRTFPEDLFVGDEGARGALRATLAPR
jgi:spermidine synthase